MAAKEKLKEISVEAERRCRELFTHDPSRIQAALSSGLWDNKFDEIWKQVWEEEGERSKQDVFTCIKEKADAYYKSSRENELVLLIRAAENGDLIDSLSRYEAGLMSALNWTLQQLWLLQNMRRKSQTIAPETAVKRARLANPASS